MTGDPAPDRWYDDCLQQARAHECHPVMFKVSYPEYVRLVDEEKGINPERRGFIPIRVRGIPVDPHGSRPCLLCEGGEVITV